MVRDVLTGFAIILVAGLVLYLGGPRTEVDASIDFDAASIGPDPIAYLAASEANVSGIRPGLQKEIVWADPALKSKTKLAIVYIHGFSASKGEIRPVPDLVARAVGANLYFTRLTGHGRDGDSMANVSVKAWVNDVAEAMAVGRSIGEKIIIMATSTGGGLATFAAADPVLSQDLAGLVLISPNYELQATGSSLLTMPWGQAIADMVTGGTRSFTPENELHRTYWTTSYPTVATLPMAAITKLARQTEVERIKTPALFILSDKDQVVVPSTTRKIEARWGGPHQLITVDDSGDPSNHVLAGSALSPGTTQRVADQISGWIKALP